MGERRAVRRGRAGDEPRRSRGRDDDRPEEPDEDQYEDEDDDEDYDDEDYDDEDTGAQEEARPGPRSRTSRAGGGLKMAEAAAAGMRQISELTGKEPEGVTGVHPSDGGWVVGIEVVEDRRVPSSADILATYEAEIDSDGDLTSYRRVRRYPRGQGDGNEGS
jgi:hypothetical protein